MLGGASDGASYSLQIKKIRVHGARSCPWHSYKLEKHSEINAMCDVCDTRQTYPCFACCQTVMAFVSFLHVSLIDTLNKWVHSGLPKRNFVCHNAATWSEPKWNMFPSDRVTLNITRPIRQICNYHCPDTLQIFKEQTTVKRPDEFRDFVL